MKLIGSRDLFYFQEFQIQRVRIVKRADGYFCQFCLKLDVRDITPILTPTKKMVGIDLGIKYFVITQLPPQTINVIFQHLTIKAL